MSERRTKSKTQGRIKRSLSGCYLFACAALLLCTVVGRVATAAPGWLVVLVMVLPYAYAAAIGFGWALFLTGAHAARRGAVCLMFGGVWLWGGLLLPIQDDADDALRVLTWNVQRFWGVNDDPDASRACFREAMDALEPDALALVELSRSDADWLQEELGMRCAHTPIEMNASGDAMTRSGLAVCLANNRLTLTDAWPHRLSEGATDHAQFAEIESPLGRFNVMAVYLPTYEEVREAVVSLREGQKNSYQALVGISEVSKRQSALAEGLIRHVETRFEDPTILAGDFNISRDFAVHKRLRESLVDTWERAGFGFGGTRAFGGFQPRVDFIYADKRFRIIDSEIPSAACSDHAPVLAELSLAKAQ